MNDNKNKFKLYLKERYLKIDKERLKRYYEENKNVFNLIDVMKKYNN